MPRVGRQIRKFDPAVQDAAYGVYTARGGVGEVLELYHDARLVAALVPASEWLRLRDRRSPDKESR